MSYEALSGTSDAIDRCIDATVSSDLSTGPARERAFKQGARCAADAYCATYGVPPGVCGSVAGPIADGIVSVFNDVFGGDPGIDCAQVSTFDKCSPCLTIQRGYLYPESDPECRAQRVREKTFARDAIASKAYWVLYDDYWRRWELALSDIEAALQTTRQQALERMTAAGLVTLEGPAGNPAALAAVQEIVAARQSIDLSYGRIAQQPLNVRTTSARIMTSFKEGDYTIQREADSWAVYDGSELVGRYATVAEATSAARNEGGGGAGGSKIAWALALAGAAGVGYVVWKRSSKRR